MTKTNKSPADYLDRHELLTLVQDLIRIPSHTVYEKREIDIANYLIELCKKENIDCYLQPADGERCNVIAAIKGNGTGKTLMFNGHMDTVPVFGMDDPFNPVIRDGLMYGRGTTDMKSGIAAMLYSLIMLKRMGVQLDGDLIFTGVIDEDAAKSTGSRVVAEKGPHADYAIVGEPTKLHPVIAHKGIDYFQIDFTGKAAHSSNPQNGANAIYAAADFIQAVRETLIPKYTAMEHPILGHPTVNIGLISGSAEINRDYLLGKSETFAGVVPDKASVYADVRWIPCQSVPKIQAELTQIVESILPKNTGLTADVQYIPLPRPAMEIAEDELLTGKLVECIKKVSPETTGLEGFPGFADSGILYGVAGIKSMIFGPGDVAFAHSINECVEVEQIYKAVEIYASIALEICQN